MERTIKSRACSYFRGYVTHRTQGNGMGGIGIIVSMIMYVIMLPFLLVAAVAAWIANLFVGGALKVDQVASENLGEGYTKPRNALGKMLVAALIIAIVLWILSMAVSGSSGADCEYGRTGKSCSYY